MSSENPYTSRNVQKFLTSSIGEIFSWNEVSGIHKIRNGIYQRNGRLISLLTDFGRINPCYPDIHGSSEDTIFYTGAGRRGDQRLDSFNRAMFNAVETKHHVPLFNKLAVGRWQFLGFWRVGAGEYVFDDAQDRMIWKFTLQREKKMIEIRKYTKDDEDEVWAIIKYVINGGDSFTDAPDASREEMLAGWSSAEKHTYVALSDEKVVATFYIKPNQPGLGAHVANGSYMVAPEARGKGVGRQIGEFSIQEAKRLGFHAMQFNFVVKSNEKAVKLWTSLGFEIIGEIPEAYNHAQNGLTNAYIMYRKL